VLEPGNGILELPHPKGKVKSAVYFEDGSRVEVKEEKENAQLDVCTLAE